MIDSPSKRPVLTLVLTLLFLLCLVGLLSLVSWVSGKPFSLGPVLAACIALPLSFWVIAALGGAKPTQLKPVPEPMATTLYEALRSVGFEKARLIFWPSGDVATFPRPMVMGPSVSISARVLNDFSEEALVWSVKTDAVASVRFMRQGLPIFFVSTLGLLLGASFAERWHFPPIYLGIVGLLVVVTLAGVCYLGFAFQVAADKRFTVTEADRQAAREALSYPYFAQKNRPLMKKWMFFQAELSGRARRLGIELDPGRSDEQ